MQTNSETEETGRPARSVFSAFSTVSGRLRRASWFPRMTEPSPVAGGPAASSDPFLEGDPQPEGSLLQGLLWWRGRGSTVERLRRSTVLSLLVGVFFAWVGAFMRLFGSEWRVSIPLAILDLVGVTVFSVLYVRMVRASVAGARADREVVVSGVVVLVLMLVLDGELWSLGLLAIAWSSGVALLLSRRGAIAVSVAAAAVALVLVPSGTFEPTDDPRFPIVSYLLMAMFLPWANRFQLWFWKVARSAEEVKEARARLAVTEERLRFSRDLHDLVGHSLSAIAVKSEVAVKLSGIDAERAAAEMDEVRGLAREALKEIRTAVRGYRTVDLDAELRSMVAVLEAGGIRCTLEVPGERIPEELATLLAWVVREGTTNVLRHSSATGCRIAIVLREGTAVLEMTNDGVARAHGRGGTGLAGLSERVTAAGGVLTAGAGTGGAGEFRLRATVPLEGAR
ncbi:sensor histidine kinase [Streptosporangium sp. NPDC051023]|uniref:sensor histidine kinase n=1 Tax=Streptosporangium sp. NPDC051023 TaxID=3155410 RepID=UPI00344CA4ED